MHNQSTKLKALSAAVQWKIFHWMICALFRQNNNIKSLEISFTELSIIKIHHKHLTSRIQDRAIDKGKLNLELTEYSKFDSRIF